ncbi:MAG TPA: PaaI family thioesterase [Acidimicrobiia bacterium]|nr:PaaI family thioesterase [Acidimicrobiia bacterium]
MNGFEETIGLQIMEADGRRVVGEIVIEDRHRQPYGIVHGGVYSSMIETLASYGAHVWATEQGWFGAVGLSNTTDFLRAARSGTVQAEATPIHQGRSQQIWQVVVTRTEDGKTVARGQVRLHNIHEAGDLRGG